MSNCILAFQILHKKTLEIEKTDVKVDATESTDFKLQKKSLKFLSGEKRFLILRIVQQ